MNRNENTEIFLTVLDGVITPIAYINLELQYIFVNKAYMDWYELERKEIEGKYIRDILASDVYERALPNYQAVLKGQSIYFENKTVRKCEEKYVSVRMEPHAVNDEVIGFFSTITDITELKLAEMKNKKLIEELSESLDNIKTLKGLLPICSYCKKIRNDQGYWDNLELYIETHSDAQFSHGLCPECLDTLYGDQEWYIKRKKKEGN